MADTKGFLEGAKGLARNPLGIIALFIALIYGFATLLLGWAADKLQSNEKLPVIWFVVLFPVLVLAAFYRLVTKHHGKLYAPTDYKDDESFLKTLPAEQQEARLEEEIASSEPLAAQPSADRPSHPTESLPPAPSLEDVRPQYVLAERLAVRKLERETGLRFQNQVSFGEGRATAFDAVAEEANEFTAVEVKYLRRPFASAVSFREALYRAVLAYGLVEKRYKTKGFRLILAVVVDFAEPQDIERVRQQVSRLIADSLIPAELRVYNFDELKREFGTEVTS